jgi:hypothetical protein
MAVELKIWNFRRMRSGGFGTKLSAINQSRRQRLFRALMRELNEPVPDSDIVNM